MMKRFIILIALFLNFFIAFAQNSNQDIQIIKKHLYDISLYYSDYSSKKIQSYIQDMNIRTGYFKDLDYRNQTRSDWHPGIHWRRLSAMSAAYQHPGGKLYHNIQLRQAIISGVHGWMNNPLKSVNGWWNLIGVPTEMVRVYTLMEQEIDPKIIDASIVYINKAVKPQYYDYYGPATGQNLLWETLNHIYSSVFANDTCGLKRASQYSASVMQVSDKEGIQKDFSFYQHGAQSYSFGYGKAFSLTAAQIIYALHGTQYEIPVENIKVLSKYILNGQQWCTYRQMLEYTSMGREISRPGESVSSIIASAKLMSEADPSRKNEYLDFIRQLNGETRHSKLSGTVYFPRINLFVQQGKNYFFSVKGASNKIASTECGNGENIKGYYLGLGTQFIALSGKEYKDIFPLWNWKQIPGCIAVQDTATLKTYNWTKGAMGEKTFVCGLSSGGEGIFAYDYSKDSICAKRSWFVFDDKILMLSSGIRYNEKKNDVYCTINQCLQHTPVYVNHDALLKDSIHGHFCEIWQDSIGYYFPFNSNLEVSGKTRFGSWRDINITKSPQRLSAKVFTLSQNWGKEQRNGTSACFILPRASFKDNLKSKCSNIEILINTEKMQVVRNKKNHNIYMAVYDSLMTYQIPDVRYVLKMRTPLVCVIKQTASQVVIKTANESEQHMYCINKNSRTDRYIYLK